MNVNADRQLNMYGLTLVSRDNHYSDVIAHNTVYLCPVIAFGNSHLTQMYRTSIGKSKKLRKRWTKRTQQLKTTERLWGKYRKETLDLWMWRGASRVPYGRVPMDVSEYHSRIFENLVVATGIQLWLCVIDRDAMKTRAIVKAQFYCFLTCGTGEINWSAAQSCPFVPRDTVPGMHWTGSRVGLCWCGCKWRGKGLCSRPEQWPPPPPPPPPTRHVFGSPTFNTVTILTELRRHISKRC
jgi:hypothetical protein